MGGQAAAAVQAGACLGGGGLGQRTPDTLRCRERGTKWGAAILQAAWGRRLAQAYESMKQVPAQQAHIPHAG